VSYIGSGSVVSVRVPPEVKREMDELMDEINWSEEIREFIKRKIQEYRKRKTLQELVSYIQTLPEAPKGTAQKLVRDDRDSY
jgi:metal-responsive CopG/Arc/MetJ family transcriptional regulator